MGVESAFTDDALHDEITNEQDIANVVCTNTAQKIEVDGTGEGGHLLTTIANEEIVPIARLTTKRRRFRVHLPNIDTVTYDSTLIDHPHRADETERTPIDNSDNPQSTPYDIQSNGKKRAHVHSVTIS